MDEPPLKRNTKRVSSAITHYTYQESPVGPLLIAGAGEVVMLINFPTGSQAQQPRPDWVRDDAMFAEAKVQLTEYFAGARTDFTMPIEMDGTDFQKEVWTALRAVPFGETVGYGELAERIGRPKASRAVGAANHANPLPIVVPCHRVIGSDRSLTGFGGGLETKQTLLEFENPDAHRPDIQQDLFQSA
ncbi:MAG: methylated-DNA--[protein]-cysteine S-methyltransferase [Alphaproteobacteria bacterium]|nr:methylated-DNA--[protein]-cysteine S-methyltransferase [Alphaproteobacteria bacterium]